MRIERTFEESSPPEHLICDCGKAARLEDLLAEEKPDPGAVPPQWPELAEDGMMGHRHR
jgi:hypothetical protein